MRTWHGCAVRDDIVKIASLPSYLISFARKLVPVVFGGDCAKDTGAVKASAVVAIAARRVGFGMDFVLSFAMGNGGDAFAAE